MSDRLYTVKDVAAMIAFDKSRESIARVMRQVRHWTNSDILVPVGGKDTGTGVSRVYDADGVRKAAIIHELVRYGIAVDMIGDTFDEWISGVAKRMPEWKKAAAGTEDFFIQFAWEPGENGSANFMPGIKHGLICRTNFIRLDVYMPSVIVVNVTTIFKRLGL